MRWHAYSITRVGRRVILFSIVFFFFVENANTIGSFATALSSRETSNDNGSHQHTWTRRTGGTSDRIPSTNRITSSTTATTTQHGNSSQLSQHRQNGNTSAHGGTNCCPMMGAQLMSPQRQPKNISNSSRFVAITSNSNNSASSVYPKGAASMMDSAADLDEPTMPDDCNYDNIQVGKFWLRKWFSPTEIKMKKKYQECSPTTEAIARMFYWWRLIIALESWCCSSTFLIQKCRRKNWTTYPKIGQRRYRQTAD